MAKKSFDLSVFLDKRSVSQGVQVKLPGISFKVEGRPAKISNEGMAAHCEGIFEEISYKQTKVEDGPAKYIPIGKFMGEAAADVIRGLTVGEEEAPLSRRVNAAAAVS